MCSKFPKTKKSCLLIPLGVIGVLILVVAISALSNLSLPQHSTILYHLSDLGKARLSEVRHLRAT
jgi:hypothetical protein